MVQTERVLKQFADQAVACEQLGSPFTAMLLRMLVDRLDLRSRFGRRILEWNGDPWGDNIALRAAGALHALARSGWEPAVTACYPPNSTTAHSLWIAIADALRHNDSFLTARLDSPPQTNEVARSGLILGAMLRLAATTRMPLELYEIGASAGLNLGFDQYRYDLGQGRVWGSPTAPLTIAIDWRGKLPSLEAPLKIVGRHGCDLRPVDAGKADDRERLISYVWADQDHRLQRVQAALKLAAADKRKVDEADAGEWLERQFGGAPRPGAIRVLLHTIVWQYLPEATRARISAALARAGAAATRQSPVAHFAFESDSTPGSGALSLTLWPTGQTVSLGRGDFHGRWAEWA